MGSKLNIEILATENDANYEEAKILREVFNKELKNISGDIIIPVNFVTNSKKSNKEIDILVVGKFKDAFKRKIKIHDQMSFVYFDKFILCIEVKNNPKVKFQNNKILIKYVDNEYDASNQVKEQSTRQNNPIFTKTKVRVYLSYVNHKFT